MPKVEYPKMLYQNRDTSVVVNDEQEESAARAKGFMGFVEAIAEKPKAPGVNLAAPAPEQIAPILPDELKDLTSKELIAYAKDRFNQELPVRWPKADLQNAVADLIAKAPGVTGEGQGE